MKRSPARARQKRSPGPSKPAPPAGAHARPLKPRPWLFVGLMIVFALWLAALVVMYFTTVYSR